MSSVGVCNAKLHVCIIPVTCWGLGHEVSLLSHSNVSLQVKGYVLMMLALWHKV